MASIGVIDSGFGGLSFVQSYTHYGKYNHQFLYAGDNARAPYGIKSHDELFNCGKELIDYLNAQQSLDAVVVACGTLSTNVLSELQALYDFPLIGISQQLFIQPVDWIEPVAVIATEKTVASQFFQERFQERNLKSVVIPTQKFVSYVEGVTPFTRSDVANDLKEIGEVGQIVLGCTHFPFLTNDIQATYPNAVCSDPAYYVVKTIDKQFQGEEAISNVSYFTSGHVEAFRQFLNKYHIQEGEIQHADFARIK